MDRQMDKVCHNRFFYFNQSRLNLGRPIPCHVLIDFVFRSHLPHLCLKSISFSFLLYAYCVVLQSSSVFDFLEFGASTNKSSQSIVKLKESNAQIDRQIDNRPKKFYVLCYARFKLTKKQMIYSNGLFIFILEIPAPSTTTIPPTKATIPPRKYKKGNHFYISTCYACTYVWSDHGTKKRLK